VAGVKMHYDALVAFSHLSYDQWAQTTSVRKVPKFSLPGANGPIIPM
jgi:hypothetical protein